MEAEATKGLAPLEEEVLLRPPCMRTVKDKKVNDKTKRDAQVKDWLFREAKVNSKL